MAHEDNGEIFVARQPIFDQRQTVYAYELLYRRSFTNSSQVADATNATLSVIHHAFFTLGAQLTGAKRVFINFGRDALLKRMPFALRPESTIIEVLEYVEVDDVITEVCKDLKRAGYLIALDDFDGHSKNAALIDFADFIKFDFRATTADERQDSPDSRAVERSRCWPKRWKRPRNSMRPAKRVTPISKAIFSASR